MNVITSISPSQISTFEECPRKWWFIYIHKIPTVQHPAAKLGTATHKALETSLLASIKGASKYSDPDVLVSATVKHYNLDEKQTELLKTMVHTAKKMNWGELWPKTFPECMLSYELHDTRVVVKIDRLDEKEESFRIIDLKTSSTIMKKEDVLKHWQTKLYSYPIIGRNKKVDIEYWFLKFPDCRVTARNLGKEYAKKTESDLENILEEMKSYDGKTFKKSYCYNCPALHMCKSMKDSPKLKF